MNKQNKAKKKKKERIEFSKIMEISLVVFYFSFYLFSAIVWTVQDRVLIEILPWISRPFAIVTSAYLVKSAVENTNRIKKSYSSKKKKKLSFSKLVTLMIIGAFFVSVLYFVLAWFFLDRFPSELMEYIATPFVTALPTYIGKNIAENRAIDNVVFAKITDTISDLANNGVTSSNLGSITKNFLEPENEENEGDEL